MSLATAPSSVGEGGSLTFDGTYIYALRGNYRQHFWRYDISTNSWSYLAYTPAGVGGGGALTYAGGFVLVMGAVIFGVVRKKSSRRNLT